MAFDWTRYFVLLVSWGLFLECGFILSSQADIRINELLAATRQKDGAGTSLEWVEVFNPGPAAVNLVDYCLTDDPQNPRKWNFPPFELPANGFFLVLATGYDYYNPGEYHANFRLDADGEFLGLYRSSDLALVDTITYPAQERDVSFGRDPNDAERWFYLQPTPGKINAPGGTAGRVPEPVFSLEGGVYPSPVTVVLTHPDEEAVVHYTLDGTSPLSTSPVYQKPIVLDKTTPLRTRAFREDYSPSGIVTHTFFIGEDIRLAKLSLVTDPPYLWDRQKGIYANASASGPDWERPASFEYIQPDGTRWFGVDAGVRIHGGASRQRAEKKSFKIYFRKEYGPGKLKLPVIPSTPVDEFDSFVLRAGYNDSWIHWDDMERKVAVYISDEMGRRVHSGMGFTASRGIFTELYLNGAYWGLYNLCERYDNDFLESYYGGAEWDIINDDQVVDGDGQEWSRLSNFVNRNNMQVEENYSQLLEWVDVEQFTSYYILNIWVQNHDWPHHNWYAVRERRADAKWKLLVWDIEDSFGSGASRGSYTMNTFANAQQGGIIGTIFQKLLTNDRYKVYFKERLDHYLATVLHPTYLLPLLDDLAGEARAAMPFEAGRWNKAMSLKVWEAALDTARTFINNRTAVVLDHVNRSLRLPTPTPTPRNVPPTPTPGGPTPTQTPTPTITPTPTPTPKQTIPGGEWGIFDAHADIGSVAAKGNASYDPVSRLYTVTGSGWDIWGTADAFHFLYKEIHGDFLLEAKLDGVNQGTSDWVKITLMARDTLEAGARHFAVRVQESSFQASSQWRTEPGGNAGSTSSNLRINLNRQDGRLRLERASNRFSTYYWNGNVRQWTLLDSQTVGMDDPIYVGLAVTSHDDGRYGVGYYREVSLTGPNVAVSNWMMF